MCECVERNIVETKSIKEFKHRYLDELTVDGFSWKTLYRCKTCLTFWEERHTDDRFIGEPYLQKVSQEYVANNWGKVF